MNHFITVITLIIFPSYAWFISHGILSGSIIIIPADMKLISCFLHNPVDNENCESKD